MSSTRAEQEQARLMAMDTLFFAEREHTSELAGMWGTFFDITRIPRDSGKEQAMASYITEWSALHDFPVETDTDHNVLVRIPATKGCSNIPGVVFQGHLDMVCVQGESALHDPAVDGVVAQLDETKSWLSAFDTTLGADNGIGIATMLTLGETKTPHGEIGLLFTTSEETTMKGAKNVVFDLDAYAYHINVDSEEENIATIGCAGGGNTEISIPLKRRTLHNASLIEVELQGLSGMHSGMEIHKPHANAIRELANLIKEFRKTHPLVIVDFDGGVKTNAIPANAKATIAVSTEDAPLLLEFILEKQRLLPISIPFEPEATIKVSKQHTEIDVKALTKKSTGVLLESLTILPHGVQKMSELVEGAVQTSTNMAIVHTDADSFHVTHMTRSSMNHELEVIRENLADFASALGGFAVQTDPFSGWEPKPEDPLIELVKSAYTRKGETLLTQVIHAGLECGELLSKYPHLQSISIGPTIVGAHTTKEKLHIPSTEKFYSILVAILEELLFSVE